MEVELEENSWGQDSVLTETTKGGMRSILDSEIFLLQARG